jgi:peptidoglycan/xylan/chitin deacetylase (PgdA/CDA1 family)
VHGRPAPRFARALRAAELGTGTVIGRRRTAAPGGAGFRTLALPTQARGELLDAAHAAGEPVVAFGDGGDGLFYAPVLLDDDYPQSASIPHGRDVESGPFSKEHFEATFVSEDPWGYTSDYEQHKYEQTLSLVPDGVDNCLELACAEGHFSWQLAPRVGRLVAADISTNALRRARDRCAGLANVEFLELDLFRDPLPPDQDLIVCSEVLYFAGDASGLERTASRIHAALSDDGFLLTAHFHSLRDEPERPGFDHGVPFGVATIERALHGAGLVLEREIRTEQYRIQRYRRGGSAGEPHVTRAEAGTMPPAVARHFRPAGSAPQPVVADQGRVTTALPILMYHRIADEGLPALEHFRIAPDAFGEQMDLLAEHGFETVGLAEWRAAVDASRPLAGRRVVLAFDDGYADFVDNALPALRRHGFGAVISLVTDHVGGVNEWDGGQLPLLTWATARELEQDGITFAAHGATHSALTELPLAEVAREASRARTAVTRELGAPPTTFTYPYGLHDEAIARLIGGCGYAYGLMAAGGPAGVRDHAMLLPRIEIEGGDDLTAFAAKLGLPPP